MPSGPRLVNRGPAAAADNRLAILAAARRLFAERGYRVPLSVIAREAGVSQGVMYRHFPTVRDLAIAVFEENFVGLEEIAADPVPDAFPRLWTRLLDLTVADSAFVELVVEARDDSSYDGDRRLHDLIEVTLPRAQRAGLVAESLTVEGVLLAWRMVYGVVATSARSEGLRADVDRALALPPIVPGD